MPEPSDTLTYYGGAVKALGDGKVGGYLIRFTSPDDPDLTGEYFDRDTDLGLEDGDRLPVFYHHGADPEVKNARLGRGTVKTDGVGVWIEAQLSLRNDYERAIYDLAQKGKLGWSSGAVGHLVSYTPTGKAVHIDTWPPGEASLTPTPAEPRNGALPVKSLPAPPPLLAPATEHTVNINVNVTQEPAQAAKAMPENPNPNPQPTPQPAPDPAPTPTPPTTPPASPTGYTQADMDATAAKAAEEAVKAFQASRTDTVKGAIATPAVVTDTRDWRYDNLGTGELAALITFLDGGQYARRTSPPRLTPTRRSPAASTRRRGRRRSSPRRRWR
jgi:hypothetical protein